jgi:hypothetical protein
MSQIYKLLARQQWSLFSVSYAPEYKTFIVNHIISDPTHPLHETQKRRARERKREGLWWHVTTGADLTKSSCVRVWARRRLRNAVIEELRARGYDENGMFIGTHPAHGKTPDFKGSLRLHIQAPLIPARYDEVKYQAKKVFDILLQDNTGDQGSIKKLSFRPQWNPPPQARIRRTIST